MGEPLTDDELITFQAVTGRLEAPTERCEELIGIIGRRGGKSRAIATLSVYLSTLIDYSDVLVTGERGVALCIAPDLKQASIVHSYIAGTIAELPVLSPLLDSSTRTTLRLRNGIDIETRSASFRRLRGVTLIAAVADEACFWFSDESSANRDSEILQAVRPALATTHGLLCVISTPYARRGATFEAFHRDYGPQGDPALLVAAGSSRDFNPKLSQRVIDRAYERDPVAAASEYGGQWRTDISAIFSRDAVMSCVDHGVMERLYCKGTTYRAWCDPSGGSNDSMTLFISHEEDGHAVIDLARERRAPFDPDDAVGEFCETLHSYKIGAVLGDKYAGQWPTSAFAKRNIRYEPSDKTASQLFLELLPLVNGGRVRLLDHRRTLDQLINLERRASFGSGRDIIGHPPGAYDDLAVAMACAALLARAKRPQMCIGCADGSVLRPNDAGGLTRSWPGKQPSLRFQNISEKEMLKQKLEGTW